MNQMKLINNTKNLLWMAVLCIAMVMGTSCSEEKEAAQIELTVSNELDFKRKEVVSLPIESIKDILKSEKIENIRLRKKATKEYQTIQLLDLYGDNTKQMLLFQAEVDANSKSDYTIVFDSTVTVSDSDVRCYSRFVPERTDDYTWENDKVAFRTYGPTGQKEALEGVSGSTLSSGIDLWLKRTDKSIIDKWYAGHVKKPGFYHIDHGEGYDPYHVGGSRGTGGIGVWAQDSLYVSENFVTHKTLADGPLRTVFELSYNPWSPYGIQETKRISLDLGSNFSKYELTLDAKDDIPNYAIGITLHENEGTTEMKEDEGWFAHWETIDSTSVGEGIVIDPSEIDSALVRKSEATDQSNLLVLAKPDKQLTYYAGFAWDKSGQINNKADWLNLLKQQAARLKFPLEVSVQ